MNSQRAILTLPIAAIAIPAVRIGYFNPKHAARLAQEIARHGQHDPIHVQSNEGDAWTLVAGLHRLRALEANGRDVVDAIQVADSTATAEELARLELSENLDHQHRRPIERAIFMARLARDEEARDHPCHVGEAPHARALRVRQATRATIARVDWRQRTADALDCSLRTLNLYQRIHRNIVEGFPDLHESINFHPLCNSFAAVNAIAARDNVLAREKIVTTLLERTDWQSMDAVLDAAGIKASAGTRVDQTRADAVTVDGYRKLKGASKHITFLALAAESAPSWVLEAADIALARTKRRKGSTTAERNAR